MVDQQVGYIQDRLMFFLTSYLPVNGTHHGLTVVSAMGHKDALLLDQMVDFVMSCWDARTDQSTTLQDATDRLDVTHIVNFVSLLQPSGIVTFLFCGIFALLVLWNLHGLELESVVGHIRRYNSFDGHWWVLSSMSILSKISRVDTDKLIRSILGLKGGGIANRPGNSDDMFPASLGVAGLSLLHYPGLETLYLVCCMAAKLIITKRSKTN
ncbi:hypothetical protein CERSUDRAFT_69210 [Gelatoporia subvermispora B]|uniref:Prenyltransferase alpha-alpha toroid domain-containing protein n=1 Tax=Ceriporiopsis subvermispora (strain B) TaxID=914234 RepID=M2QI18_CERS8|nr:hypothetical protein CERSUDRAFT_69210 [Gelatoporia subvermispora B]